MKIIGESPELVCQGHQPADCDTQHVVICEVGRDLQTKMVA